MSQVICAIYDLVAEDYLAPFFGPNTVSVIRQFGDAVREEGSHLAKHPRDYCLRLVGYFHTNPFSLEPIEPTTIATPRDFIAEIGND